MLLFLMLVSTVLLVLWPVVRLFVRYFAFERRRKDDVAQLPLLLNSNWGSFALFRPGGFERVLADVRLNHRDAALAGFGAAFDGARKVAVLDIDAIRTVLRDTDTFGKLPSAYDVLSVILGPGLLTSSGDLWARQRRLLSPLFEFAALRRYESLIADEAVALCDVLASRIEHSDLCETFANATLAIIIRAVFGRRLEAARMARNWALVLDNIPAFFALTMVLGLPAARSRARWLRVGRLRTFYDALDAIDADLLAVVRSVRASGADAAAADDLIAQMALMVDPDEASSAWAIDEMQIVSEAKTLLFAAHDTTSSTLAWCMFFVGQRPELQERLRAEASVGGQLPVHGAVVSEALRLRPPAPITERVVLHETVLAGVRLPVGTAVVVMFLAPAWSASHFGPTSLEFDADRSASTSALPFSVGPRSCVAQRLARLELKVLLSHIVRRFRVEVVDADRVCMKVRGAVQPANLVCRMHPLD